MSITSQSIMEGALKVRSMRADLLAENVANADTPGFQRRDIRFDQALEQVVAEDDSSTSTTDSKFARENVRVDGNNIDANQELGHVYDNAMNYIGVERLYADSVARLKSATSNT